MTEESTITDYTSGDDGSETDAETGNFRSRSGDDPDVDPVGTTYGWGAYDCARCGSATDRIWVDGEELVCPSCKEW